MNIGKTGMYVKLWGLCRHCWRRETWPFCRSRWPWCRREGRRRSQPSCVTQLCTQSVIWSYHVWRSYVRKVSYEAIMCDVAMYEKCHMKASCVSQLCTQSVIWSYHVWRSYVRKVSYEGIMCDAAMYIRKQTNKIMVTMYVCLSNVVIMYVFHKNLQDN
jgi:hypothetical protein